jgi:predicted deacylase
MLDPKHTISKPNSPSIYIEKSGWIRAKCSGLLHDYNTIGTFVKRTVLAIITDPYGKFERKVKAPNDGYVINANHSPIVYEGMLFTLQILMEEEKKKLNCDRNTKVRKTF